MKSLLVAAALVLAGCAHMPQPTPDEVNPPRPKMPTSVRALCDPVPVAPKAPANMGALLQFASELVGLYGECALQDKAKAAWVESQGL